MFFIWNLHLTDFTMSFLFWHRYLLSTLILLKQGLSSVDLHTQPTQLRRVWSVQSILRNCGFNSLRHTRIMNTYLCTANTQTSFFLSILLKYTLHAKKRTYMHRWFGSGIPPITLQSSLGIERGCTTKWMESKEGGYQYLPNATEYWTYGKFNSGLFMFSFIIILQYIYYNAMVQMRKQKPFKLHMKSGK